MYGRFRTLPEISTRVVDETSWKTRSLQTFFPGNGGPPVRSSDDARRQAGRRVSLPRHPQLSLAGTVVVASLVAPRSLTTLVIASA